MSHHLGEFSTHRRDGDHVTKRLNGRHPAGNRFVTAMTTTGAAGMQCYLHVLRSAHVRLPSCLRLVAAEPLTVRHRWVAGPTLLDAPNETDPATFAAAIAQIGRWVRDLDGTDARIDTNLANFCLEDDQLVLVDVLPPLIPSLRPAPESLFDELFGALCFDTPVILDALVGYALRTLLRTADPSAAQELLPFSYEFPTNIADEGFPAAWFRARRGLAVRAAMGEAAVEEVQDFFALTSVLGFRQLDEAGRRLRIDQVARRIREW
ncbi:hypothetical protein MOQ72_32400 [Saccharopolyspora sp. K220]|uniref:hypothetical protein n=1 Tax=Saccharopolyspora soli TaxID=2926618 RepID=UPI001F5A3486|nr:hypothetical protein [Saccharopolyspora soli]MCI2422142.1 hypothetical protein [Saccharopolyspora soli]